MILYRIITVATNPEVTHFHGRRGALIHRRQVKQWLDFTVPEVDLLVTPPGRRFLVEKVSGRPVQTALVL